jgi:hypothetical protein
MEKELVDTDTAATCSQDMDSHHDAQIPISKNQRPATVLEQLNSLSINGRVDDMRRQAKNSIYVAGRMALAGQITVFYAGPNTGKTLITLKLVSEAIANGTAGDNVYHINLDDSFEGLIDKGDLGNDHGFKVLGPDTFTKPNENFAELVNALITEGSAGNTVFILDTIKKFVDVMDKKSSSQFMTTCRALTSAGGTIIALAHINKQTRDKEESIPGGTSDILDDCDCAYVLDVINETQTTEGKTRTVEFQQKKSRGPTVESAAYSYTVYPDADYHRMFNSVNIVDGNSADQARAAKALTVEKTQDAALIHAISDLLSAAPAICQQEIVDNITSLEISTRRKVVTCLKRWSCPANEGGLWTLFKGESNSNHYQANL